MNRQHFDNCMFQQPDPKPEKERQKKTSFRAFWFIYFPLGAIVGFAAAALSGSGTIFFPVWGLTTLFMWAFNR